MQTTGAKLAQGRRPNTAQRRSTTTVHKTIKRQGTCAYDSAVIAGNGDRARLRSLGRLAQSPMFEGKSDGRGGPAGGRVATLDQRKSRCAAQPLTS